MRAALCSLAGRWPGHDLPAHAGCALPAGVAALYLADNPGATPAQVSGLITSTATLNKVSPARFKPGTPNRLLYSRLNLPAQQQTPPAAVQAASGP